MSWFVDRLIDRLVGWLLLLAELIDRLIGWFDRLIGWLID